MADWAMLVKIRRRTAEAGLMCLASLASWISTGCASPGPALPPSLKLPDPVTDLAAVRVGDEVRLSWTTPSRTTDGLSLKGLTVAEICRETVAAATSAPPAPQPCAPILHILVTPGPSDAVNLLPASLTSGTPALLAYRIQLRNKAGRTAGPSPQVFTASGPSPQSPEALQATAAKDGAVLAWRPAGGADVVELDRTILAAPRMPEDKGGPLASPKEPLEVKMRAGSGPDSGGTIDRTAATGRTYRYTAQRVNTVIVGGTHVEVRSPQSRAVTLAMVDVFPPDAPTGLLSAPGFLADAAGAPVIDLSWEPTMEAGLAGYWVYRHQADEKWLRLGSELIAVPGYRDAAVGAGKRYAYRVTAVDGAGNESKPSGVVEETAPSR